MTLLKGFQKKYLRGLSHGCRPLVLIGKEGITEGIIRATDEGLARHELIKVKFNDFKEKEQKEAITAEITGKTDSGRGSVAKWVRRGAFVEIIGGPFESLCGVIEKVKSSTLVTVTVTMLGGESPVDMSVDWIAWRGRGAK